MKARQKRKVRLAPDWNLLTQLDVFQDLSVQVAIIKVCKWCSSINDVRFKFRRIHHGMLLSKLVGILRTRTEGKGENEIILEVRGKYCMGENTCNSK